MKIVDSELMHAAHGSNHDTQHAVFSLHSYFWDWV